MLTKLWNSVQGYKTHIIAWGSVGVVLLGHFYGPITIGSTTIPQFSTSDLWSAIKTSGLFSALRSGVASAKV